jgi:hypothetical protein
MISDPRNHDAAISLITMAEIRKVNYDDALK